MVSPCLHVSFCVYALMLPYLQENFAESNEGGDVDFADINHFVNEWEKVDILAAKVRALALLPTRIPGSCICSHGVGMLPLSLIPASSAVRMKHAVPFQVVHLFPSQMVPCARFINILKNTPGACGFKRPEGYVQVSKAEIIKRLVALNIPVYEVDPKVGDRLLATSHHAQFILRPSCTPCVRVAWCRMLSAYPACMRVLTFCCRC
jgi:hypothetical protein